MFQKIEKIEQLSERFREKKLNPITSFLLSCAGVNKEIARQSPNELSKYAGVGGTILFTGLMAALSGGYALFFIFDSIIASVFFGVFWGLLIFNLDRYIVNSMYVDDSPYLNWTKLKLAAPRLIMAVFLGIVISTPLEMKIFSDKIDSQIVQDNISRKTTTKQSSGDYKILSDLQKQQDKLLEERAELNNKLLKAEEDLRKEAEGKALSGIVGHGPIYEDKKRFVEKCQESLSQWDLHNKSQLNIIQNRIKNLSDNIIETETKVDQTYDDGFIARYEAFSNLKNNNPTLSLISLMITLLFIIIEMVPTFFKLIMEHGLYDKLCDADDSIREKIILMRNKEIEEVIADIKKNEDELLERTKIAHEKEMLIKDQEHIIENAHRDLETRTKELVNKQTEFDNKVSEFNSFKEETEQNISEKDKEILSLKNKIKEQNKDISRMNQQLMRNGKKKFKFKH